MSPEASIDALRQAAAAGDEGALTRHGVALLNAGDPDSAERARTLEILRQYADEHQSSLCQCMLGMYFVHHHKLDGAVDEALHWLKASAAQGAPMAIDRLAALHAGGELLERSTDRAIELLERLAAAGFQKPAWELGYLLSLEGREPEAAGAFARACALGYPPAFHSLGLRFAEGRGVARDPEFAAALFARAADAGYPGALEMARDRVPEALESDRTRDWYRRLTTVFRTADRAVLARLQRQVASVDEIDTADVAAIERHFASIEHPALAAGERGRLEIAAGTEADAAPTPAREWACLSDRPRIRTCAGFVSAEERAQVLFVAAENMRRPEHVPAEATNNQFEPRLFDGTMHVFEASKSDVLIGSIKHRIALDCQVEAAVIEPLSVIRYGPGHEYRPHVDYFPESDLERDEQTGRLVGQRIATFLICLNPAEAGGETCYDRAGVEVAHRTCMAAIHYNVNEAGRPELDSLHRSNPVTRGEKWLLRTAIRDAKF